MYCYPLIALVFISLLHISTCGILILSLDLASMAPSDWTLGQRLILALAYLAFVGILPVLLT